MSGAGQNSGTYWRKRNDKVITYDLKKPNREGYNRTNAGPSLTPPPILIDRSELRNTGGLPYGRPSHDQPSVTEEHVPYQNPRRSTRNNVPVSEIPRKSAMIQDKERKLSATPTHYNRDELNDSNLLPRSVQGAQTYEVKPELAEKMLKLLKEVGNEDFDMDDLKEQDSLAKRADIIKKGISNLKQEAQKAEDLQRENKSLKQDYEREIDKMVKEISNLRSAINERDYQINNVNRDSVVRPSVDHSKRNDELEREITSLKNGLRNRENEVDMKNREINDLLRQVKDLQSQVTDFTIKSREQDKRVEDLERMKNQSNHKEADWKFKEAELRGQIEELKRENDGYKKRSADVEDEKRRTQLKIEEVEMNCRKSVNAANGDKELLEKEIKDLNERIVKLEKSLSDRDALLQRMLPQINELNKLRSQITDK